MLDGFARTPLQVEPPYITSASVCVDGEFTVRISWLLATKSICHIRSNELCAAVGRALALHHGIERLMPSPIVGPFFKDTIVIKML